MAAYYLPAVQGNATPIYYQLMAHSMQPQPETITTSDEVDQENDRKKFPWSIDDNKVLASSWLTISRCTGEGESKNKKSFWRQVTECYNENRKSGFSREDNTVKSHWNFVNNMVIAFNQYYNELVCEHGSDWNDDQVKQRARELFYKSYNKHFVHEYLWVLLKDDSNWNNVASVQLSAKKSKTDGNGESAWGVTPVKHPAEQLRTNGNEDCASDFTSRKNSAKKSRTDGNGESASGVASLQHSD